MRNRINKTAAAASLFVHFVMMMLCKELTVVVLCILVICMYNAKSLMVVCMCAEGFKRAGRGWNQSETKMKVGGRNGVFNGI